MTKVYERHNCSRAHRTEQTFMKCAVPRAAWVEGKGKFASIAWGNVPTVWLFEHLGDAEDAKAWIDRIGCGGNCYRRHEVVRVETGGTP